jgi:hypothetical protein
MYIGGFLLILVVLATPSIYKMLTPELTCIDGIQNQGETAIDLGGPCHYLNPADLRPLSQQWARSFVVIPGLYSSVAYVENPNLNGGIRTAHYVFKLYDARNILVAERVGQTFIPPGKVVPIFEGNMQVGGRVPQRTTFQFIDTLIWEKMDTEVAAEVLVGEKDFREEDGLPRLSAMVQNKGVYTLSNLVVVATLFDEAGNAVGASRTIVERLAPDSEKEIIFTWPKAFNTFIARTDIVPLLPPIDTL